MAASVSSVVDSSLSLIQAAQGGFEVGNSSNSYAVFTNALNLAGTFAGQGPWATGMNSAATVNNTVSALNSFKNGTLQPSEILQITGSALSLAVAAAAIAGAPVTTSALVLAGVVGIVAGPGPLQDQFNEYATKLGQILLQNVLSTKDIDEASVANSIGSAGNGGAIIVRQYDYFNGANEIVTFQFADKDGTRSTQIGVASGNTPEFVLPTIVVKGTIGANGNPNFTSYNGYSTLSAALDNALDNATLVSSYVMTSTDAQWGSATSFVNGNLSFGSNTADFAFDALSAAYSGLTWGSYSGFFGSTSLVNDYSDLRSWLSHPNGGDFYYNYFNGDFTWADQEADSKFYQLQQIEGKIGYSDDDDEIVDKVNSGVGSPIAVDLNGDGLRTVSYFSDSVLFDIDGDGKKDRTGWLDRADGFIAYDADGSGKIDGVNELFGGMERGQGYAELSAFDDNRDGHINAADASYSLLSVWQDANSNGSTDLGELASLLERGVVDLSLDFSIADKRDAFNIIGETSSAMVNGASVEMADIYFRYRQVDTENAANSLLTGMSTFSAGREAAFDSGGLYEACQPYQTVPLSVACEAVG